MNKTISPKITALTFGILAIAFLAAFYVVAWQEPTQAPPGGNVAAPINVGPAGQSKEGGLILNTGGAENGLIVDRGTVQLGGNLTVKEAIKMLGGANSYFKLPSLTTSQRDALSPETGMLIYNITANQFQIYEGGAWKIMKTYDPTACDFLGEGSVCGTANQGKCAGGLCIEYYWEVIGQGSYDASWGLGSRTQYCRSDTDLGTVGFLNWWLHPPSGSTILYSPESIHGGDNGYYYQYKCNKRTIQ